MTGQFTLDPQPALLEGDGFALPTGLRFLARPGEGLITPPGLPRLPPSAATPCYAGRQEEELSLDLPPGYRPTRVPRERRVEEQEFSYRSRWTFEAGVVRVRRRFASSIDQPLCDGPLRTRAAHAVEEIRRDLDARVELERERDVGKN